MNILILSWRDPKHPLAGGAEQVMHEHAKAWLKAGHTVTLFSAYFKGGLRKEDLDGVTVIRHGYQILGVHIWAFFWYLFGKHDKYNLVVDQFHGIPFFTPFYVRVKKVAVVQEVAREVWLLNHLPKPFNWIIGFIGYVAEPLVYVFYKHTFFITGSKSAKKDLIQIGIPEKRIKVINHGVIAPTNLPKVQKEKTLTVVFLGALAKDKGIEDAIKSFSFLRKNRKYNFWIIGKGSRIYKQELDLLVTDLDIKNDVTFFGFVNQNKKFELLSKSHVLINPSIREGWGLVNIEANIVGVPVVAYSSPGLIDSIRNNASGLICKQNTPEELASNIDSLLSNRGKYMKMQKSALKWAKRFSWGKSSKESLVYIEKLNDFKK